MFEYHTNSLLGAALINGDNKRSQKRKYPWPNEDKLNTLGTVSALYIYTNPPPMGYGTPAPKVMETVNRAYSYNRNPEDVKQIVIDGRKINFAAWNNEKEYPFGEITGNWHPGQAFRMYKRMLVNNFQSITTLADNVICNALVTNSDILTQGKQTWCPLTRKSVPSAQAYINMASYLKNEMGTISSNCLEWIKAFFDLMNTPNITEYYFEHVMTEKIIYDNVKKQKVKSGRLKRMIRKRKTQNKVESKKWTLDLLRSFCSYIKHGERGKMERRAIASANVGLRMFFYLIENFHLELGKVLPGSTISIGGEEKKVKITTNLNTASLPQSTTCYRLQSTQDATKFNECLFFYFFECFSMMHMTFFSPEVRNSLKLPPPSPNEIIFNKICQVGHYLLAIKMISIGETPLCINKELGICNRPLWKDVDGRLNEKTQSMHRECIGRIYDNYYLTASPGMLMGMHNAASTTLALGAVMHNQDPMNTNVATLRSSDNSMTVYACATTGHLASAIETERRSLKLLGVNLSKKKTWIYKRGYGEYTSWYQDGSFVSQFGVETSTIRPQGQNPPDDFNSLAKSCAVSQLRLETNPVGAEAKLQIGIDNIRRLWRIEVNPHKHEGVSHEVQVLSDGGANIWDCMNCHLEETSLKELLARTEKEKEYLLRIRNPNNPFIGEPEEQITWSRDTGALALAIPETPRTIFHTIKRANRAILNIKGPTHMDTERANAQVMKIVNEADLSTCLHIPSDKTKISDHVYQCLLHQSEDMDLDDEERTTLETALSILRGESAPDLDFQSDQEE